MLCILTYTAVVAQVDIVALIAICVAIGAFVLNLISVKQTAKKMNAEHDDKFATKELLSERLKSVDMQLTLIDKEISADRATNLREHDSIKTDFVRQIESVNGKIQILIDLINKKLK